MGTGRRWRTDVVGVTRTVTAGGRLDFNSGKSSWGRAARLGWVLLKTFYVYSDCTI